LAATLVLPAQAPYPFDEGDRPGSTVGRIFKYPLHRVADFFDMFSGSLGFGLGFHVNVHATRALQVGMGGATVSRIGGADAKREWGVYQETIGEFSLLFLNVLSLGHSSAGIGTVVDFDTGSEPDRLYRVKRDFTGIGAQVTAAIVSVAVEIRPVEIVDFVLGFLFVDIADDDF